MKQLALLLKQRSREGHNGWRTLRTQSRLKVAVITSFVVLFEGGLFALFYDGFRFLDQSGSGALLINRLFAVFFLGMSLLLVLSAATAAYGALFRSRDVPFLLTSPIPLPELLLFKWLETTRISAWTYLFIVLPFVGAFAAFAHGSILFVVWTACFSVPLLALCAAGSGHSGGTLSIMDIAAALYLRIADHDPKNPEWEERDRVVLSNGHICPVLYATMAHVGYFPVEELKIIVIR